MAETLGQALYYTESNPVYTLGGVVEAFIAYHCERSTNAQHYCEPGGNTRGVGGIYWPPYQVTSPAGPTPTPISALSALCKDA